MEISDKRKVTDYVRKCIKNGQQIKTRSGKYGFIPHEGEDKLFEQCYKEGDPIRSQFDKNLFLSEKYCHLVEVCSSNGNIYFVRPSIREPEKGKEETEEDRWLYFKRKQKDREIICPSGIPVYTVYALVFGSMIFDSDVRKILENNIYRTYGAIATHHVSSYKEPKVENGVPIFEEDAKNLIIYKKPLHDNMIYRIPSLEKAKEQEKLYENVPLGTEITDDSEAHKFDEDLDNYIAGQDKEKIRISVRKETEGKNTDKTGKIILVTGDDIEDIETYMRKHSECPKCLITFKGSEEDYELYKQTVYQCLQEIADELKNQKADTYYLELYNGLDITAYKHVNEDITPEDIRVLEPVKL